MSRNRSGIGLGGRVYPWPGRGTRVAVATHNGDSTGETLAHLPGETTEDARTRLRATVAAWTAERGIRQGATPERLVCPSGFGWLYADGTPMSRHERVTALREILAAERKAVRS